MPISKEDLRKEGVVTEALKNVTFRVQLDDGRNVLAYLAGRLQLHQIKIIPGDKVIVELSPYDQNRGRIIYRLK